MVRKALLKEETVEANNVGTVELVACDVATKAVFASCLTLSYCNYLYAFLCSINYSYIEK